MGRKLSATTPHIFILSFAAFLTILPPLPFFLVCFIEANSRRNYWHKIGWSGSIFFYRWQYQDLHLQSHLPRSTREQVHVGPLFLVICFEIMVRMWECRRLGYCVKYAFNNLHYSVFQLFIIVSRTEYHRIIEPMLHIYIASQPRGQVLTLYKNV